MIRGRPQPWPEAPGPAGVYLHFPFCVRQCSFCDFPTVIGQSDQVQPYVDGLVAEIEIGQPELPRSIDTVYLGGGTPSRMSVSQLEQVLGAVRRRFDVAADSEISLECNPEDLDLERIAGFRDAGVNRISLGVQSFRSDVLRQVGRLHDREDAFAAMERIAEVPGIAMSVDLIAGLPGDRFDDWETRLRAVVDRGAVHLSVYSLEIDKPTSLRRAIDAGRVAVPGVRVLVELYARTRRALARLGLEQYEVASFCYPGRASRHNLKYWTDAWYGGFGLGAHGYAAGRRRRNLAALPGYLERTDSGADPLDEEEPWDLRDRLADALIAGLRPLAGVDLARLGERYGIALVERLAPALAVLRQEGTLSVDGARIRLTDEGRLRLDPLLSRLLDALGDPQRECDNARFD